MVINAYTHGSRKFSHTVFIGNEELILYFSVEMSENDVNAFSDMLGIKNGAAGFYACVVISERNAPRTFIAYSDKEGEVHELFDISTGISPIEILRRSFAKGEIS